MKRGEKIHPHDRAVFSRLNANKHGFQIENCLPSSFWGPLKTAPVVLLYLSPGFSQEDVTEANSEAGKDYYLKCWEGKEPLPSNGPGFKWFKSRTKDFGEYTYIRDKIAVLNIGAYHSKNVKSYSSLIALPSSRVALSWAQTVLFPQAIAGTRIVICMRSAEKWGLDINKTYGKSLYVPPVNRSGYMLESALSQSIKKTVREAAA